MNDKDERWAVMLFLIAQGLMFAGLLCAVAGVEAWSKLVAFSALFFLWVVVLRTVTISEQLEMLSDEPPQRAAE